MKKIKKFYIVIFVLLIFLFSYEYLLKKTLELSLSRVAKKEIIIKKIELNLARKNIKIYDLQIFNEKNFSYPILFSCEEISLDITFNSIFSDLITVDNLIFFKPIFYFEILEGSDNLNLVQKKNKNYKPKIYPKKKKDKNFIITNLALVKPLSSLKYLDIYEYSDFKLSEMTFNNVGNSTSLGQHYKDIFKFLLLDIYLRIPNLKVKKEIKKIYKL